MFHRKRKQDDFNAEVEAHIALETARLKEQGMSEEDARAAARRAFGNVTRAQERFYESGRWLWWDHLRQDVRFGLRMLRKNPGFTAVAVLTLALGIGANTAIFSVIDAALLRPLPYEQPELLVNISTFHLNGNPEVIAPDFRAWQEHSQVLSALGAFGFGFNAYSRGANLTGIGGPVRVHVLPVTVGFFRMLGVRPTLGRDFGDDEGQPGHNQVALVSAPVWRQDLGGDRAILGKTIHLDGAPYTIIGVMPAGLLYPPGDLWVPLVLDASNSLPGSPDFPMLYVIGRLKPNVSLELARENLEALSHALDSQFSAGRQKGRARWRVDVIPLRQILAGDVSHLLLILLGAVGFVLVIACSNLANLLLARATTRGREVAVRAALGATRFRLVRQFLTECALLTFFGAGLGLLLGLWGERALKELIPPELPASVSLDPRIFAFVVAVSTGALVFFGMVPALAASRVDVNEALKEGGVHAGLGRGTHRLRNVLVIGEMALALVLLTGAGLLARSFLRLSDVKLGFDPHHLLLGEVYLPVTMIDEPQRQANFFGSVLERLRASPGVESAAATTHFPVSIFNALATGVLASGGSPPESNQPASLAYISPGYFQTLRIRLLKGRFFNNGDAGGARNVAVLSESEAHNLFADRDPVGQEISFDGPKGPWRTVVGVVADTRNYQLEREPWPEIFIPYQQQPSLVMTLVVRTSGDPRRWATPLTKAVQGVDPNEPVSGIQTMDEVVRMAVGPRKFKLALLGCFAILALLLGSVGLYGVISYSVTERTHEIGIRMALGAGRQDVLRTIIRQGVTLALVGVGSGVGGALALTRFLSSLLYGVQPTDPLTFFAVSLILTVVALLASYIPARRATKVDPIAALRCE